MRIFLFILTLIASQSFAQSFIKTEISNNIQDNNQRLVTPGIVRNTMLDMVDYSTSIGQVISTNSTVSRTLSDRFAEKTNVLDFGAVGNGSINDNAALVAAYQATPLSGTMYLPGPGSYLVSGTSFTISKSISLEFGPGASLLFNKPTSYGLKTMGNNITLLNPTVTMVSPSTRTAYSNYFFSGDNLSVTNAKSYNSPGAGYEMENLTNSRFQNILVSNSMADGFTIGNGTTGASKHINLVNLIANNTGDDGVSVVSYNNGQGICEDINIVGIQSNNSAAAGLTIAGGRNVRVSGIVNSARGPYAVRLERDGFYNTFGNYNVVADMTSVNALQRGALVGRDMYNGIITLNVSGSGSDGVVIGGVSSTLLNYNTHVDGKSNNNGGGGWNIDGTIGLSSSYMEAANNGTTGINVSVHNNATSLGSLVARNNSQASAGTYNNIFLNGPISLGIGSVFSVDDQSPSTILNPMRVTNVSGTSIGPFFGMKNSALSGISTDTGGGPISGYSTTPKILSGDNLTYDPPALLAGQQVTVTVVVSGSEVGDFPYASHSSNLNGVVLTSSINSSNAVLDTYSNPTSTTIDVPSGILRNRVLKK